LIEFLAAGKEFATSAKFEDLLVVRSWLTRHSSPYTLSQRKVDGGYILSLKRKYDET
jgi:hypothetical protein